MADQTYNMPHLAQEQGKFCSLRHLAEPLRRDSLGRSVLPFPLLQATCMDNLSAKRKAA